MTFVGLRDLLAGHLPVEVHLLEPTGQRRVCRFDRVEVINPSPMLRLEIDLVEFVGGGQVKNEITIGTSDTEWIGRDTVLEIRYEDFSERVRLRAAMPASVNVHTGIAHGRFQVFHNDHLKYVLASAERCEHLVVGLTSPEINELRLETIDSRRSDALENPLTFYERMEMIKAALAEAGVSLGRVSVVPFPIEEPGRLRNYVDPSATFFMTIYDEWGEEKRRRLMEEDYVVDVLWRSDHKGISGRDLRTAMINDERWQTKVPSAVAEYVQTHGIVDRLRNLASRPGRS